MSTETQNGGQGAAGTFGAVKEQAESLVHRGVETINQGAAQVQANVQSTAQSYVDQAKTAAASELQGAAQFVRNAIPSDNAPPIVSQYANQAAESLERVAKSLQDQDLQSLVAGVNDFARRQPALFLGASVAVGFVVARFLRSKSPQSQYRYGAPASSLYPPQDFQYGHGATSPGLSGGASASGRASSGSAGGYGGGGGQSSGGQHGGGSRSTSYGGTTGSGTSGGSSTPGAGGGMGGGQSSGGQHGGGGRSTSYGGTTGSGTSGGSSTPGAGAGMGGGARTTGGDLGTSGGGNPRGGEATGVNTSGGITGGGLGGASPGGSAASTASGGSADRSGSPVG